MILPPWAYVAAGLVTFGAGLATGWTVRDWKADSAELADMKAATKSLEDQTKVISDAAATFEKDREDDRSATTVRENTIREYYRDRPARADCAVPEPVVSVLEDARRRANARAGSEPGGALPADPSPADPAR